MKKIIISEYHSPCGLLTLGSYGEKLCLCDWQTGKHGRRVMKRLLRITGACIEEGTSPVIEQAMRELDEYFSGTRRTFSVPLLFAGTDFQKRVWEELRAVPYGTTVSYGEMAVRIGRPKAVRAVANANGANALSVFVPCHRVIGTGGMLTGYAGGLDAKRFLLQLEKSVSV
ncbi:MAG: methylated-DNA--[protein]-cysteine S-methyltransferase [Bacteroidales bacterium]|nr:methylated-DNA--[protein]-cysteine S-methyltransferase [Bacteroidales bacterium]MCM1147848.1 methylated-DNA--[protein]-cysteine S-methyltransferase [Bacteroidales bacterium]MCM1206691.1 methylated-DNA--[protein]-cysteine S-methyltransferase [Bacillota bacterium]MCM1510886.1 methylated-DNA--[protein]-cysteine S-methyltransferase [Clostridium sp.]